MTQSGPTAGFCTNCGTALGEVGLRFCTNCGAAQSTAPSQLKGPASTSQLASPARGSSAKSPSKRRPNPFVVAVVCLLAVAGSLQLAGAYDIRDLWRSDPVEPTGDEVIASVPSAAKEAYIQGTKYMKSRSYSEAVECFETAVRTYGDYSEAWNGKGEALEGLGREAEALVCFQTAVLINPEDCLAWINEGNSLEYLGRSDEAMSCFNQALQLEPDNEDAIQSKQALLDGGTADNSNPPPAKEYTSWYSLRCAGGWTPGRGENLKLTVNEGEPFETYLTVSGGQPPYYWFVSGYNSVASLSFEPNADGSAITVRGIGADIPESGTVRRGGSVSMRVEDSSSQPTKWSPASFDLWVENKSADYSAVAAEVAREWHQNNYGDISGMLQQAVAGLGSGAATVSYSNPVRRSDGYYEVTDTVTISIGVQGQGVYVSMDCVLIIDATLRRVVDSAYGEVRTSY
jgi:tetratricopeptide (TPR) repeat protein